MQQRRHWQLSDLIMRIYMLVLWTDARDTLVLPTHCEQVVFKADPIEPHWWYVVQVAPRSTLVYEDLANPEIEEVVRSAQNHLLRDGEDSEEDEQQVSRVLSAVVEEVEENAESDDDIDDDKEWRKRLRSTL